MLYVVFICIAAIFALGYAIDYLFAALDDPREPRRVYARVPIIGHVLCHLRYGYDYYLSTSNRTNAEIYTIGACNFKVYVTKGTRLAQMAQRSKALSFAPLFRMGNEANAGVSAESNAHYSDEVVDDIIHRSKETLSPGTHLDAQNMRMGSEALRHVSLAVTEENDSALYAWLQHVVVQATASGLYGARHPFKDPAIERAMWIWDDHRPGHTVGFDPLRTGYNARAKVFKAFQRYFHDTPEDAAEIVRERQAILLKSGIPFDEVCQIQATLSDAAYPSTVPTTFWTIFEIFSRPKLLEEIRAEVSSNAVQATENGFVLDVAALKTRCPVLLSAYQETQRTRHSQVAFRMVKEDVLLDGQYLLKKGNLLHMPAKPTHRDASIWGPSAPNFDPYRFVPQHGESKAKVSPSHFMPWGSAPHLCPARQFASTEIMILTALLCMRVDLLPVNGKGWPAKPLVRGMEIPTLPRPRKDVRVKVVPREKDAVEWALKMGESRTRVPLTSG